MPGISWLPGESLTTFFFPKACQARTWWSSFTGQCSSMDISNADKVRLIDRIGEIDFRMTEGANERIQLEALLAYFVLAGSKS